jgi:hypothetical protein
MKIVIHYESSWRNSFLDGDNNSPIPKNGRDYLGSMTNLKKDGNFIRRSITLDTVMGLLNRLIGDQRKLYQARNKKFEQSYFFEDLESKVSFKDYPTITNEIAYLRNMKGSTDQNLFTGMIRTSDPLFAADYSSHLWGVLSLSLEDLLLFILNDGPSTATWKSMPLDICRKMNELEVLKPTASEGVLQEALNVLNKAFPGVNYLNKKGKVVLLSLYCSALYIQVERLRSKFDMDSALTKSGAITGISKRGFTAKDFMARHTTGPKKMLWGNPYILKQRLKGEGEVVSMLEKAGGRLEINLDIDRAKALELKQFIDDAAVSSFYLGKKGLAYLSTIRL